MTQYLASGTWQVKEGSEDEFVDRWREFLEWTKESQPAFLNASLLRDEQDPTTSSRWPSGQRLRAAPSGARVPVSLSTTAHAGVSAATCTAATTSVGSLSRTRRSQVAGCYDAGRGSRATGPTRQLCRRRPGRTPLGWPATAFCNRLSCERTEGQPPGSPLPRARPPGFAGS
jgi:hypothetical protein